MTEYTSLIATPNYPNKYPRLTSCLWDIDFGPGMDIHVKFLDFNVEDTCDYDYVTVSSGVNGTKRKYCGFDLPPPASVKGGPIQIGFVSDDDTELSGFSLEYEATGISAVTFYRLYNKTSLTQRVMNAYHQSDREISRLIEFPSCPKPWITCFP